MSQPSPSKTVSLSEMAKFLVSLASTLTGTVGAILAAGLISGETAKWATIIVSAVTGLAGSAGVFFVPNEPGKPSGG